MVYLMNKNHLGRIKTSNKRKAFGIFETLGIRPLEG